MQGIFDAALLRETTRTTHTTIHYNVLSNQESLRASQHLSSTGCMRNEESTKTVNITTDDQEGANDGEDRSTTANISFNIEIPFSYGPKGSKLPGLDYLVLCVEQYHKLLSYRYYLLANNTATPTTTSVMRIYRIVKNLEVTMNTFKFLGEDPILIYDFLSRLVREADVLEKDGGKVMACLSHMLAETAALA